MQPIAAETAVVFDLKLFDQLDREMPIPADTSITSSDPAGLAVESVTGAEITVRPTTESGTATLTATAAGLTATLEVGWPAPVPTRLVLALRG